MNKIQKSNLKIYNNYFLDNIIIKKLYNYI